MADNEVDMVNHPPHYGAHPSGVECIQVTRDMSFSVGNAVKYVWRADLKNGREDLEKAQWYLKDAIAHEALTFCGVDSFAWKRLLDAVSEAEPDPNREAKVSRFCGLGSTNAVSRMTDFRSSGICEK